jgi:hypothetical protein
MSDWLSDVIGNDLIAVFDGLYFTEDALLWLREKPRTFGELREGDRLVAVDGRQRPEQGFEGHTNGTVADRNSIYWQIGKLIDDSSCPGAFSLECYSARTPLRPGGVGAS